MTSGPTATDAVKQWIYRQTMLDGTPAEVVTQIEVYFTLPERPPDLNQPVLTNPQRKRPRRSPRLAFKELMPMLTKTTCFGIAALYASIVLPQPPAAGPLDRVFHFTHAESDEQLQEIATDIRGITAIPQVSVDTARKTLTLYGTAAEIAAAEWLLNQLDESGPTQRPDNPAAHTYRLASHDIIRVFHLAHAPTPKVLQEVATDVRSIANIRRLFTYNGSSGITVRGDASQIALAEWLVNQLDQPAGLAAPNAAAHEYRPSGTVDDVVRVFYPANTGSPQGLQEMATDVRSIGNIRRLFTYNQATALIARGTAAEMMLAEWLVKELDQSAGQLPQTSNLHEYRPSGAIDDVVRVFFLTHAEGPQRLQQIAIEVRSAAEIRRIFTYNPRRALALRGTAAQIALAERLISERDR